LKPQVMQAQVDSPDAAIETRLRQALRDTMGQLRDAQSQLAVLQAAQAQSDKDKADLQAKTDALTAQLKSVSDQAAADKAASGKTIADLRQGSATLVVRLVDALTTRINNLGQPGDKNAAALRQAIAELKSQNPDYAAALDQYGADIQSWAAGYDAYVQLAKRAEAEGASLAAQVIQLRATVADRETKNLTLYQLGGEILTRYEKAGLGTAIFDKEPFIGLSRVKLENLVQDYKDKLRDQIVIPGQPVATAQPIPGKQPTTLSSR
jgi:chromosome segregation ATPase